MRKGNSRPRADDDNRSDFVGVPPSIYVQKSIICWWRE
jgi:hypothetical protein